MRLPLICLFFGVLEHHLCHECLSSSVATLFFFGVSRFSVFVSTIFGRVPLSDRRDMNESRAILWLI